MKTTFSYDHYWLYDEMKKALEYFADTYPRLCQLESICTSEEGRNVYAISITDYARGDASSKPALHIDGLHHAGEVTGSMAALHIIDVLLTNFDTDKKIEDLLEKKTVYVVPRLSPDGAETYLSTPYTLRSVNRVHDPKYGGIKAEDLDGDGVIRMMRIPTPYGAWKKDPNDSGKMVKRAPDDSDGEFYDIYPEGILEEYDGMENLKVKKPDWSLDFNRNYPYGWFPEHRQEGAGKYPLSNPENKALADWIIAHPNIFGVSTNHTSGGVILYPPGTKKPSAASSKDIRGFHEIAAMGKEELGYEPLNIFESFISDQDNYDSGAFDDWCYQSQGLIAYTVELWDLDKRIGMPIDWNNKKKDPEDEMKRFNATVNWVRENCPQYYVPWKEFDHPFFGKVEIGGFNIKFTHQNPPQRLLKEVCEKMSRFMLRFAKAGPQLRIDDFHAEKVSEDVYKIIALIGNNGYLPTNITEEALNMKIARPLKVTLEADQIVSGKAETEIPSLEGYSSTISGAYAYGNLTTARSAASRKKLEWIVQAKEGTTIRITAGNEKTGMVSAVIKL